MKTISIAALVICVCTGSLHSARAEQNPNPQTSKVIFANNPESASPQASGPKTMPEGTAFSVNITQPLDLSQITTETSFTGALAHPIYQREMVLVPGGTKVQGKIAPANQSAKVPELTITDMMIDGQQVPVKTISVDPTGSKRSLTQTVGKPIPVRWSQLQLPKGSMIEFRLAEPVTVK
jgi:hypothetical protein